MNREDLRIRQERVQCFLKEQAVDACLINSFINIYYLTGKVFDGYIYLPNEGEPVCFVRKPTTIEDERVVFIYKPEDIPALLRERNITLPKTVGLEADQLTYNEYVRLEAVFNPEKVANATTILRRSRILKTPWEIEQFRHSAARHSEVYGWIPSLFKSGMTDLEFQCEIERAMRKQGSIGIFRAFGSNMDIFMGSLLTGDNAATPSPCDFALGGGGSHACLPIGANGSLIKEGQSVMVDMAGNFTAYLTDMTRVYACGALPDIAYRAHQVSIDMHQWLMKEAKPGVSCASIYIQSLEMVKAANLSDYFMGIAQQAKFVGHGVGMEINELPVMTGRSKDLLQTGMVFAYEPKFVLPGIGAVGIENTYLVAETGLEKLTISEEAIINL